MSLTLEDGSIPSASSFYFSKLNMVPNFLKTGLRNFTHHKGFSFINVLGLALGFTACLLIGFFVRDEKQYDAFIPSAKNIFRVYQQSESDAATIIGVSPPAFSTSLKQNYPEVDMALRVMSFSSKELFEVSGKKIYETGGFIADSNFFELFPLPLLYGSHRKVLDDPGSIVLSEAMSRQFFGNEDPVGKTISFDKSVFTVKAVLKDKVNFHLPINFLINMSAAGLKGEVMQNWQWYPFQTYVKLKPGSDPEALQSKFQAYAKPYLKGEGGTNLPYLQPLRQIHLYSSNFKYDLSERGNISYVNALMIIAFFILLIAGFNFVNLATAKSMQRAKEVGVRKAIGASKNQLVVQFIGETIILSFISMSLALTLTYLLLPELNRFTQKQMVFDLFTNPVLLLAMAVTTLLVGILAGFYPALVLSAFRPVKVLKGTVVTDALPGKTPWLRHGLVVIQFSLSLLLIISSLVVIQQVRYMYGKDLGFKKDQVILLEMRGEKLMKNYESFKNELTHQSGVLAASVGYGFPGDIFGDGMMTVKENHEIKPTRATQLMVDADYIQTLELRLIAGRDFSKNIPDDVSAYVINETAVVELGLGTPQQAIGKTLSWPTWRKADSLKTGPVIGVVRDFHYKSLHERVEPAVLHIYPAAYSRIAVKLKAGSIENSIAQIKTVWNRFSPDYPMEYTFLDESFGKMYQAEDKLKTLLSLFTGVTIFVACLGLFGLAAFAAERRKKEIGIRKVLGATVRGVVIMLSKDFILLVLISLILASPVAWYFMNQWLENFSYRIHIGWWIFALAGMVAVLLAFITVSLQAVKAGRTNPVKNLRAE
jgi:putative ABC transport system permease protein